MEETSKLTQQQVELQLIAAKQQADFSLTPVGQMVKQFEVMQRMGQMYSSSTIIPEAYRGNLGNCIIALDLAMRMKINPLMCMQNLYIVQGIPSWSSKFLIATINMSGRYTSLRYRKRNLGVIYILIISGYRLNLAVIGEIIFAPHDSYFARGYRISIRAALEGYIVI